MSSIFRVLILLLGLTLVFTAGVWTRPFVEYNAKRVLRRLCRIIGINRGVKVDPLYPILTSEQQERIRQSARLTFCGDLILLRDVVENALDPLSGAYEFHDMFADFEKYWRASNTFTIGVLEGPVAGLASGRHYSNSIYSDRIRIRMNFPDSYVKAIRDAGIRLVTVATNHLLDYGESGMDSTLDTLDKIGLDHVGGYRSELEKQTIKVINVGGHKAAVLAYTYGCDYYPEDYFFARETSFITRVIVPRRSKYYKRCREAVAKDFEKVSKLHPELIIVLPHMGQEFLHAPDEMQRDWADYFLELGADVVLADHPHAVQPVEWRRRGDSWQVVVFCPGNFINSYTDDDGDASMLAEVYLDRTTGKPFAASCVPIYAYGKNDSNYRGLCLYDALEDVSFCNSVSKAEYKRMSAVHRLVTKTALGVELPIDNRQDRYYLFPEIGYVRQSVPALVLSKEDEGSVLLRMCREARSVCFVGDSITEGTKNGGYGWFEPLMGAMPGKRWTRIAAGGKTSKWMVQKHAEILGASADLYVIAIGCNDIRYRDQTQCAMTAAEFVGNVRVTVKKIQEANSRAKVVIIAPWRSRYFDPYCHTTEVEKSALYEEYNLALMKYCAESNCIFIDPNPFIDQEWEGKDALVDHIHPNAREGVRLFSQACLKCTNKAEVKR